MHEASKYAKVIIQNYIVHTPMEEVRTRLSYGLHNRTDDCIYELTIKKKTDKAIARHEVNTTISKRNYTALNDMVATKPLTKVRVATLMPDVLTYMTLDNYDNLDYIVIEVEFPSEDDANSFVVPEWFGKEVTEEKTYSALNLWKKLNNLE